VAIDPALLTVLHRDAQCVIVEKPHGVPAAATRAANRGTLAQALVQRLEAEGVLRPYVGLVHNLPAAAAGLALFTIRGQATESFYKAFAELPTQRRHRVRLRGTFVGEQVVCEAPLCHLLTGGAAGSWRLARDGDREPVAARSVFRKIAELGEETLAAVEDASADAIRLHAAALGLPIVGEDEPEGTLCLLAERLAFTQPVTGAAVVATASVPAWALLPGEALVTDEAAGHGEIADEPG
jgi:23S rRNA-/tRNA-specific pseudouridylate synthase